MKRLHILNIGYPKCGTTWLWEALVNNGSIADHSVKENHCLTAGIPVADYCRQYTKEVTANFSVNNIMLDQYVIEQLSTLPQVRASIILRTPVDFLWSLYNFTETEKLYNVTFQRFCYQMYDRNYIKISDVVERWKNHFGERFNVFWYKDLKENNSKFFLDYCNKMQLAPGPAVMPSKINITKYQNLEMPLLDQDLLDLLEEEKAKLDCYTL